MTKRIVSLLLCAVLCMACLPALAGGERVLYDMTGREVKLTGPVERIVVLDAADCEILYAIGAGEMIVGRGEYCNYPEEAASVPVVNSGSGMNLEQIIALQPQVVVLTKMGQTIEHNESLERAGIRAIVTDAQSIDGVYDCIRLMGELTGKTENAQLLINDMRARLEAVAGKCENTGKTVYFEVSELKWGLWAAGGDTFMDEAAKILGLTNAFGDVSGWQAISEEQVLSRDPDYIITTTMYFGEGAAPVDEILGRTGWSDLKAIQNGHVYNADNDEITRPGPRLVDAIEDLYAAVYGQ